MSEPKLNLYQKIVEVRKIAEGFTKDGKSYSYNYVTGNQVLGKIKDKMNELNLLLFPSTKMGEHHTHAYKTSKGKDVLDFVVKGEMSYTWINGDEPTEREVISWAYYGQQDDISKAYGSALTYSERYFLLKCLGLPTDEDDPDGKPEKPPYQPQNNNHSNNGAQSANRQQEPNTSTQQQNASTGQTGQSKGQGTLHASGRVFAITKELGWKSTDINKFASEALGFEVNYPMKDYVKTNEQWETLEKALLVTKESLQAS